MFMNVAIFREDYIVQRIKMASIPANRQNGKLVFPPIREEMKALEVMPAS